MKLATSSTNPAIDISPSCPANVVAAFAALDLSDCVVCGSLFTDKYYDHETGTQSWMVIDRVFNTVAVMRGGSAVILARRGRKS